MTEVRRIMSRYAIPQRTHARRRLRVRAWKSFVSFAPPSTRTRLIATGHHEGDNHRGHDPVPPRLQDARSVTPVDCATESNE
jgi:hypothetical protein